MRLFLLVILVFTLPGFSLYSPPPKWIDRNGNKIKDVFEDQYQPINKRVANLLGLMTLEEKVGQMVQYPVPSRGGDILSNDEFVTKSNAQTLDCKRLVEAGLIGSLHGNLRLTPAETQRSISEAVKWLEKSRLKIPLLIAVDAVHGNALTIGGTVFANPINIGATFDEDLAQRIADATAEECVVLGQNWTLAPNIEIARDMRWGRIGETFGEDPLAVSRLGVASIRGFQKDFKNQYSIASCAKHFIAGSQPSDGRNSSPTDISERTLLEFFYPPFRDALRAGAASVMLAHNEVNGVPCHSDSLMISQLLKLDRNFDGIIISDYMDVPKLVTVHKVAANEQEAYRMSVRAGLDMNMMGPGFYEPIVDGVKKGTIKMSRITDAVTRILTIKFKFGLFDKVPETGNLSLIANVAHQQLALESARKSIVLLKNKDHLLPLAQGTKVFVTGPFADNEAILGDWVAPVKNPHTVTIYTGLKRIAGDQNTSYYDCGPFEKLDLRKIDEAKAMAAAADVSVVVVGQNPYRSSAPGLKTEGENIDRNNLGLPGIQQQLIEGIAANGKPVIVVYINGGPIADEWIEEHANGLVEAFYPGMMGGQALAEILFGTVNPGGKMPYTVPRGVGYLNSWYYERPSKFSKLRGKYASEGPDKSIEPLHVFGEGLSYTSFAYSELKAPLMIKAGEGVRLSVKVTNTGKRQGEEVVMLFRSYPVNPVTTPERLLTDFKRISLPAGESCVVELAVQPEQLTLLNNKLQPQAPIGKFIFTLGNNLMSKEITVK